MSFWFLHGLRRGIQSTRYPRTLDSAPGVSPGHPINTEFSSSGDARDAAASCPVDAILADGRMAFVDDGLCIHCQRCRFGIRSPNGQSYLLAGKTTRPCPLPFPSPCT
jgi:hypothetical protein